MLQPKIALQPKISLQPSRVPKINGKGIFETLAKIFQSERQKENKEWKNWNEYYADPEYPERMKQWIRSQHRKIQEYKRQHNIKSIRRRGRVC